MAFPAGAHGDLPSAAPRPGDVVAGQYRVERVLGKGGMGVVVAAVDDAPVSPSR